MDYLNFIARIFHGTYTVGTQRRFYCNHCQNDVLLTLKQSLQDVMRLPG